MIYTEQERNWLASLKVGDTVAVVGGWYPSFAKVTSMSGRYITAGGERFRKDNGRRVGDAGRYSGRSITEPTQDMRDEFKQRKLVNELGQVRWSHQPLQLLQAVKTLLEYREQNVTGVTIRTDVPGGYGVQDMPGWDGRCKES